MTRRTEQWLHDHKNYPHDYCLIWPFARDPNVGRGSLRVPGKSNWAHRVMCEMVKGPPPTPKHECAHSCGNGHQGCVNPNHLSWKTRSENQIERYRIHGRGNPNANGNKSRFTPEQIEKIRSQHGEFTITKLAEMYGCSYGTIQYYLKYRERRGHAGGTINHWTPDDDDRLREAMSRGYTYKQAGEFVGRAEKATASRCKRIGLKSEWVRPAAKQARTFQ